VWRRLVSDEQVAVRRAYSVDAVTEELAFVLGPVLATALLAWLGGPPVVLACLGVLLVAGAAIGFHSAARASTVRAATASGPAASSALWRDAVFLLGLMPVAALGLMLGAAEMAAVAAALASVDEGLAGVPSSALAVGSLIGGLVYGHRQWRGSARSHALVLTLGTAVLLGAAALVAGTFAVLVLVLGIAGLTIAPAIVASYVLADEAVPVGSSEATAWVNAAFNTALAGGTAAAGVVVDMTSPGAALGSAAVVAALLATAAGTAAARHRRSAHRGGTAA
jgi:hypothetical protein